MKWSIGRGKWGQVDEVLDTCWDEFAAFMSDATHLPLYPAEKEKHWWVAPFILKAGSLHRQIVDVDYMAAWLALDIDHCNVSLQDIRSRLLGTTMFAYTTTQSRPDDMRWRVFIKLDREVTIDEYARIRRWQADKFPAGAVDRQTSNANRIFYMPADWHGAVNVFHVQQGRALNTETILAMVPEITPPPQPATEAATRRAPNGAEIVTRHMLAAAQAAPVGGRLFRLLCQAAKRFRVEGWALDVNDLAQAGAQANASFAPGKLRKDMNRQAQRAIDWAASNFSPQTPMERMRNRILFDRRRFK